MMPFQPPQMNPMGPMMGQPMPGPMDQPMPPQGGQEFTDPVELLAALKELAAGMPQHTPVYPPGFTTPKKPTIEQIKATADRLYERNRTWRHLVELTLRWAHQKLAGAFPEDIEARQLGFSEEYVCATLSAERETMIGKVSTLKPSFRKQVALPELKDDAQRIEDAANWMRQMYADQHAAAGNRPLAIDEATLLVDYGMFASRQTFVAENPDFPLDRVLIDPTQVYPVFQGRKGLRAVYRVYCDTLDEILACYASYDPKTEAAIKKAFGDDIASDVELQCYEYWDEWWRCVIVGDVAVVPVTDHRYGFVPWTIQYGGLGDPMFTRSPFAAAGQYIDGKWRTVGGSRYDERMTKAVPMLYYQLKNHEIYEAIMARLITGFKKEIHPPMVRERSNYAAEKAMPDLDLSPGAQNEVMLGEERLSALPTATAGPTTQMLVSSLVADRKQLSLPQSMSGVNDKSNVTGAALMNLSDAGFDKLTPIVKPLEVAYAREIEQGLLLIRNFGDLAKYGGGQPTPLIVPGRKSVFGAPGRQGFELTPEMIDRVGGKLTVKFTRVDPRDWVNLFNAGKIGVDAGFVTRSDIRELAMGEDDYERFLEEWMGEQAFMQALQLPEFAKAFTVPSAIAQKIQEHDDDPRMQALFHKMLDAWLTITQPQPQQPGMPGQPQPGMAQGQPQPTTEGGPPPPPPGAVQVGPSTAGLSLPGLGMAPGANGAAVGRPPIMGG